MNTHRLKLKLKFYYKIHVNISETKSTKGETSNYFNDSCVHKEFYRFSHASNFYYELTLPKTNTLLIYILYILNI